MKMEPVSLETIWAEYGERLRRFLLSKVSRPEDADDLVQDILIRVHKKLPQLRESGKLQSWLFQIARNALIDHYRRSGSSSPKPFLLEGDSDAGSNEDIRLELTGCLQPFLKKIPGLYRQALTEVDLKGVSQKALALRLGISHSAVKSRVQRGRAMLKDMFFECCSYCRDARGGVTDYRKRTGRC